MSYGYTFDAELRAKALKLAQTIQANADDKRGNHNYDTALNKLIMDIQRPLIVKLDRLRKVMQEEL